MGDPQLPLFDWPTSVMGTGYRSLAAFNFDEAEQHFMDVHLSGQGDEAELSKARHACQYWKPLINQSKTAPDNVPTATLYKEFRRYDLDNVPGLLQFAESLLQHIANRMLSERLFYINKNDKTGETVSDLLIELGQYKRAERAVLQRREHRPDEGQPHYILAQLQWNSHQKGEARKNYTRGLLSDPDQVPFHRLEPEELRSLIGDVGAEMAPAFGWVRGVLPLIYPPDVPEFLSDSHQKAYGCYRLLWQTDKALQNGDMEKCISCRKKLKAEIPDLYDEYFALLSGRAKIGKTEK